MSAKQADSQETADVEKVHAALDALSQGKLDQAEQLLLEVIANTPCEYQNSVEDEDGISIKFWGQADFIQYVTWQSDHGLANKNIQWIGNAYPRAYYHLGFLCVKRKQFARAIEYLAQGRRLEPHNPMFVLETAQAMVQSGRLQEALSLFDQIHEIGPHISAHNLAVARRGRGFVLIEMGDLDRAEAAFKSSLEIEPQSSVALNELQYISHLRSGGKATFTEAVASSGPDHSRCAVCGNSFQKGVMVSVDGMPLAICNRCQSKLTKKWWQFWK